MRQRVLLFLKKVKAFIKAPNFACTQCGECCSRYMICVTHKDAYRVAKEYGLDPHDFLDCIIPEKSVEETYKGVPRFLGEDGKRWVLCFKTNNENSGCCFNNGGPCSIYPVRPLVCRAFPFLWRRLLHGHKFIFNSEALEFCKGLGAKENKFDFDSVARDMIQSEKEDKEYAKLVEEWNKLVEGKKIKSPSLDSFIDFFMKTLSDEENEL
ncbi:MAG: YkgJ family cysteine cluster protein [Candidatus Jordarchaeaceae archaeon]